MFLNAFKVLKDGRLWRYWLPQRLWKFLTKHHISWRQCLCTILIFMPVLAHLPNQAHLEASAYTLALKTYFNASATHWHFICHRFCFDLILMMHGIYWKLQKLQTPNLAKVMESSQDLTKVTENIDLALTWLTFLKVTERIQQTSRKMHWI